MKAPALTQLAVLSGVLLALYWPGSASALMMVAAVALTCLLVGMTPVRTIAAILPRAQAAALRAQSRRTAFLRQRDPDAAGRVRPRAPSASPAAA